MKLFVALTVAAGLGFLAAWFTISNQLTQRYAARLAAKEAAWFQEKQRLLAALDAARRDRRSPVTIQAPVASTEPTIPNNASAAEIMDRLKAFRLAGGPNQSRSTRELIHLFESLAELGPAALPVIRDFLARNEDLEYGGRGDRRDSVVPASLRLGLFEVLRKIGGEGAEAILAGVLNTIGRGIEVLVLSRLLEEMAPGKHRDPALTAARDLLANPITVANPGRLDQRARDYLYEVLTMFKDTTFAGTAETQLVRSDGRIDETALRYLERTMGDQYLAFVQQAYNDVRIANPQYKEPLLDAVVERVGQNSQANELLYSMVTDERLPARMREEAIRELDNEGINEDNPGRRTCRSWWHAGRCSKPCDLM